MIKTINKRFLTLLTLVGLMFGTASCGGDGESNISIPGVKGPNVTLLEDNVIVSMVMENVNMMAGATYQIPKFKNSYIGLNPNLEGAGSVLTFTVSLDDMFSSEVQELDPKTLPGGRMIPGVATGSLPAVAFKLDEKLGNTAVYVGPKVFGIWVPLPEFNVYGLAITYAYKIGDKRLGNLTLFGKDAEGEHAGFFLALSVKDAYAKKLKKLARKY